MEWSQSFMTKNYSNIAKIKNILKEFFAKDSILAKELSLYNQILNLSEGVDPIRVIQNVKLEYMKLDQKQIFSEQTKLLFELNKQFGKGIFSHFIPRYQMIASINGILNSDLSINEKMTLENKIIENIQLVTEQKLEKIDNLVYKKFVVSFNEKYGELLPEQKELIKRYISSFDSDGIDLAVYLNTEVKKIKQKLVELAKKAEDKEIKERIVNTMVMVESWSTKKIQKAEFIKILKIQDLIAELGGN